MKKIPFTKMHGCGNDYIYVNAMQHPIADPSATAIQWSDRHKGIGSDGIVLIDRSPVPEADYSMRIFNADGSEARMCGNACRCVGKYLYEKSLTPCPSPARPNGTLSSERKGEGSEYPKTTIRLLTLSGIKMLYLHINNCNKVESVTVDMGEPVLEDESLFEANREISEGVFVSMGNPHFVIFTDDINQVAETGRILEYHPAFPQRCNIEFARSIEAPSGAVGGAFRTRVWERGSGITMACGTGACATAVAACLSGRAGHESDIVMDGGTLHIEWRESDNHVYMSGPAELVFEGEAELPNSKNRQINSKS